MPRKTRQRQGLCNSGLTASMRPRPDAAENAGALGGVGEGRAAASMRPRPDAAENARSARPRRAQPAGRFNEAAARCRGKPTRAATAPASSGPLQ